MPRKKTHNAVLDVPYDPDSDPSFSYSSLLDPSYLSDERYYKQRRRAKKNKNKRWIKTHFNDPIKKCANIPANLLTFSYKSKVIQLKLDEDPKHCQVYFLSFINSPKIVCHHLNKHKCCLWTIYK